MRLAPLLFCTLLIGLFFEFAEPIQELYFPERQDFFLFGDREIYFTTWVYYLSEHIILVLLSLLIYNEIKDIRLVSGCYMILQIIDTVDYILTYNAPWFAFDGWTITFNVFKILLFSFVIAYELIRHSFAGPNHS